MKKLVFISLAVLALAACKKDEAEVTATGLAVSEPQKTVEQYDQFELKWEVTPADASGSVNWISDNPDVAEVEDGIVTAKAVGKANIRAVWVSSKWTGIEAKCELTVKDPVYTVARLKLDKNNNSAIFEPLPTDWDCDFENHYLVLYDHAKKEFVKGIDKNESSAVFTRGADSFQDLKIDWGVFQYYGALVVPQKPCEKAGIKLKFVSSNLSVPVEKTVFFKTSYKMNYYFGAPGTKKGLPFVISLGNAPQKISVLKPNKDGTALEQVMDGNPDHYEMWNDDATGTKKLTVSREEQKSGDTTQYYYLQVKKAADTFTSETDGVKIQYTDENGKYTYKVFRFKTSTVSYYYF
jgi:hypothetical protein